MFMTQILHELVIGQPLGPHKFFQMVEHPGTRPWLYVRVQFSRPGTLNMGVRYYCCTDFDLLRGLIRESSDIFAVTDVMLVTPDEPETGTLPRMELLEELGVAVDPVTFERVYLCRTQGANFYHYGLAPGSEDPGEYQLIYTSEEENPED